MIDFPCPDCGQPIGVPDSFAGRPGRCPGCNAVITVPGDLRPSAEQPAGPSPDATRPCPVCGEIIKVIARKCRFCNEFLDGGPAVDSISSYRKLQDERQNESPQVGDYLLAVLCSPVGCIMGLVYLSQGRTKRGAIVLGISMAVNTVFSLVSELL